MTKNEIIEEMFEMFDNLSFMGVLTDHEEERLNQLYDEYIKEKNRAE